jgi:archaemetzincin
MMKKTLLILIFILMTSSIPFLSKTQKIYIQPMGHVSQDKLKIIEENLTKTYNTEIIILEKVKIPNQVRIKNTDRLSADKILWIYNSDFFFNNKKILVVTSKDICTTRFLNGKKFKNWGVFGLGTMYGSACVVSTFRIKSTSRLIKVAIHEIGHTKGLSHCKNVKCVMTDARGLGRTVDNAGFKLCDKCIKEL